MDLAFLLIASLVLLVREPETEEQQKADAPAAPAVNMRIISRQYKGLQVDEKLTGQSLGIEIASNGMLTEFQVDGPEKASLALKDIAERLKNVKKPRTIVLRVAREVPYEKAAQVREHLETLQIQGEINEIVEAVAYEEASK